MDSPGRPWSRAGRRVLTSLGLAGVFVAAALGGTLLHANLPLSRQFIAHSVSSLLSDVLVGTLQIPSITTLTPSRITIAESSLLDEYGNRVVRLNDIRIDISLASLLRDFVAARGIPKIMVRHVRVERSEVDLIADPVTGEPTIVRAIAPTPKPVREPGEPDSPAETRVYLPEIELGEVVGHARFKDQPPLEGVVRRVRGQLLASPRGLAVDVERFGAALRGYGTEARGTGTLEIRAPGPLRGSFQGFVGDIELKSTAFLKGSHLIVSADILNAPPAAVARLVPGWPVLERASGHVQAEGDLPVLEADATLNVGAATVEAKGPVKLAPSVDVNLTLKAKHVDIRSLLEGAPATDVDTTGSVHVWQDGGKVLSDLHLDTEGGTIALPEPGDGASSEQVLHALPKTSATVRFSEAGATGTAEIQETGSPARATFSVSNEGAVDVDATSRSVRIERSRFFSGLGVKGAGTARVRLHIEKEELRATVVSDLRGVTAPETTARSAHVEVDARGPLASLSDLRATVRASATGLVVSGIPAERARLTAKGNRKRATFELSADGTQGITGQAAGTAVFGRRLLIRGTKVALRRGDVGVEGEVTTFDPEAGSVDVPRFRITGAGGTTQGSLVLRRELIELSLSGENVDLDALGTAFNLPHGTIGGKARIDAELTSGRDITRGRLRVGLANATVADVTGISIAASADLEGQALRGEVSGLVKDYGKIGATWNTTLGGPAYELGSFQKITGDAEVQLVDWSLETLAKRLPEDSKLKNVHGHAFARLLVQRPSVDAPLPNVFATVETRGLSLDVVREPPLAPVAIAGMDVSGTGAFDGTSGNASGSAIVIDGFQRLLSARFGTRMDPKELRADPARSLSDMTTTPIDLVLELPPRLIADLPEPFRLAGVQGTISGSLSLIGSIAEPTFAVSAIGQGLGGSGVRTRGSLDVKADAQYGWNARDLHARAEAFVAGRKVGAAELQANFPDGHLEHWTGESQFLFDGLPIDLLTPLAESEISGRLSGSAVFGRKGDATGHPAEKSASAELRILDPAIARSSLGAGRLSLESKGPNLLSHVSFASESGVLDADVTVGWKWPALLPELARDRDAHLHVVTKNFAAQAFTPFVRGLLSRLGGRVDADVTVHAKPSAVGPDEEWGGTLDGAASLKKGSAVVDVLGVDLKDLTIDAEARGSGGQTHISVRNLSGRVRSAKDNLSGSADIELSGLRVTGGTATLRATDLPLLLHGAPQGRATGAVFARMKREPDRMRVDVDIPSMNLKLPQSSARNVIDVSDNPDVVILQFEETEESSGASLPWRFVLHLGSEVNIRRSDVDLGVTGAPTLDLDGETRMSGTVNLVPGGRIPVIGKVFSVDHGRVIFDTGENSNPRVELTAAWRAQGDTVVYVEVTGTMREAKIRLRSDPPLPEPEIFALLLGGSAADRNRAAGDKPPPGSSAAGAVALGSGVGALGVNELLSDSPLEIRVETTAQSRPRYTAAVRIRPNLWFEASTYQQSQRTPGSANDRSVFSGTVDYRFTRRWSLRTEVGNSGGAMDLLWQYRY